MDVDCALFIIIVPSDQREESYIRDTKIQGEIPSSLCTKLKGYLAEKINEVPVWILSDDKNFYQVTFHAEFGFTSDTILHELKKLNIGINNGSQVSVIPATVMPGLRDRSSNLTSNDHAPINDGYPNTLDVAQLEMPEESTFRRIYKRFNISNFKKSIRARLMVHQVVATIRAASTLSFDFVVLISLASMLAAVGLLENSSVIIVASMLVSPLMNPIMGIVFGISVREHSLWRRGLQNELIGLVLCIAWGFIIGLCTTHAEVNWGSSTSFPTSEMKNRGDIKRLWVGVLIALPSGAGVALSILGGNTGSLVGVAISASLLPPAVNCGLLLAYASLARPLFSNVWGYVTNTSSPQTNMEYFSFIHRLHPSPYIINCSRPASNMYSPYYSCDMAYESAVLGMCSLLLTLVNIVCIIIMALVILRIKEVVPLHQTNESIENFFHHDVKVARNYNRSVQNNHHMSVMNVEKPIINHQQHSTTPGNNENRRSTLAMHSSPTLNHTQLMNLSKLQTYAKDFHLNVLDENDRELLTPESVEKVSHLAKNLLDVYEEDPSTLIDLSRCLSHGGQISAQMECCTFYEHLIHLLPPKWHQIFERKRRQRLDMAHTGRQRSTTVYARTNPAMNYFHLNRSFTE